MVTDDKPTTEADALSRVAAKEETRDQEKVRRLNDLQAKFESDAKAKQQLVSEIAAGRRERAQSMSVFNETLAVMAIAMVSKALGEQAAPFITRLGDRLLAQPALPEGAAPDAPASADVSRPDSTQDKSGSRHLALLADDVDAPRLKRRSVPSKDTAETSAKAVATTTSASRRRTRIVVSDEEQEEK